MSFSHIAETIHLGDGLAGKIKIAFTKAYYRLGLPPRTIQISLRFKDVSFPFCVRNWVDLYSLHSIFVRQEFDVPECSNPKVIVDLGGNIGASALFYLIRYPESIVYVAEPALVVKEQLEKNLALFSKRVVFVPYALWNTDGEMLPFETSEDKHLSGTLYAAGGAHSQSVETMRLDTFQKKYNVPEVDILKYNVEGAEWEIFSVASLDRIKYLIGEFHPDLCGHSFDEFLQYFTKNHILVSDLVSRKGRHFSRFIPQSNRAL